MYAQKTPPLCKGRWQPEAVDGGIVKITFHNKNNPSVSSADSSTYTGEPMAKFDAMLKPTHNVYINL